MPTIPVAANAKATLDRRAALGSLAAAAALLAVPRLAKAAVLEIDPALAAIDRHKAAAAAFEAFLRETDDEGDEETYDRLNGAERNAMFELADTVPTTHAGAQAALHYLVREAGDRHYRVLGIFGASLIVAKWQTTPALLEA